MDAGATPPLTGPVDRSLCPHPGKLTYSTKKATKQAIARLPGRQRRDELHAYRCECGFWHVGHKLRSRAA